MVRVSEHSATRETRWPAGERAPHQLSGRRISYGGVWRKMNDGLSGRDGRGREGSIKRWVEEESRKRRPMSRNPKGVRSHWGAVRVLGWQQVCTP